jgi:hypothetical protein
MLRPRQCNVDSIGALNRFNDSQTSRPLTPSGAAYLQEANRRLPSFKRAGVSHKGNNHDFGFLPLEGVYCPDTNLQVASN